MIYIFLRLNYIKSYGTGIEKIIDSYKEKVLKPKFDITENSFVLTLFNTNKTATIKNTKSKDKEEIIIEYIKENGSITRIEVQKILGLEKAMSNKVLTNMCKENRIKREGNGRSIKYIIY